MRLDCKHGFFIFQETKAGQISDYMSLSGATLVEKDNYYTFEALKDAPKYSLTGKPYLGIPAVATFEGNPWEVFEENEFVYDFTTGLVRPLISIVQRVSIAVAGNKFISNGLILPGSFTDAGKRITGYSAWYSRDRLTWNYSAVYYV